MEDIDSIERSALQGKTQIIPLYEECVQAGFPSPAQGEYPNSIDLNQELIKHPASTFCARVQGDSMVGAGIEQGDLLIIDRSIEPQEGQIALCYLDGGFTVKRITWRKHLLYLTPANANYPEIPIDKNSNFQVWGIVTYIIKRTF